MESKDYIKHIEMQLADIIELQKEIIALMKAKDEDEEKPDPYYQINNIFDGE